MYVIAAVIILFTIFGAIGVWKEIRWALIVVGKEKKKIRILVAVIKIQFITKTNRSLFPYFCVYVFLFVSMQLE